MRPPGYAGFSNRRYYGILYAFGILPTLEPLQRVVGEPSSDP